MIQFQQYQNPTLYEELLTLNTLDKSFTIKVEKISEGNWRSKTWRAVPDGAQIQGWL